ncbi:phosphatase PAP2 family protein [Luteimicrobium sp. DT211]|uniref:phosphatase PAP2 family protein n=1 Tax=Luteimicrobium sp. DT211 TaxID=3393412 RepID=UPI003CFA5786
MRLARPSVPSARARACVLGVAGVGVVAGLAAFVAPAQASGTSTTSGSSAAAGSTDPWGRHFVDSYRTNVSTNTTGATNAAIGLLSPFSTLWQAGSTWDTGTALDAPVLESNIAQAATITQTRTAAQGDEAYLDDRRNQSYSSIAGLGSLADAFRAGSNAGTTIPDTVADDATTTRHDDGGNANGAWADTSSSLGKVVELVNTLRGNYSSGNNAKSFYQYPRPWRQSDAVSVLPALVPAESTTPATDGGFPSGHTNAAYLASFALAYAYPERYDALIGNASEIGNSRIVAGMHSPLDVMGGRVLATALAAAILDDPANSSLEQDAHAQAESVLSAADGSADDSGAASDADYARARAEYRQRLTYGFTQTGDTHVAASVPKGAEALLRTRLPYLSDAQLREVLRTTALPSGYPFLDDAEGWGRLDLFSASNGYGALDRPVTATMDASQGGFDASDTWRNAIAGKGSLTKKGSGALTLSGANAYRGGTTVDGGTLTAASTTALGTGSVATDDATLAETATGTLRVGGNLTQRRDAALSLTVEGRGPAVSVAGRATLGGSVKIAVADGAAVASGGDVVLVAAHQVSGRFQHVEVTGLASGYRATVEYRGGRVHLVVTSTRGHGAGPHDSHGTGRRH